MAEILHRLSRDMKVAMKNHDKFTLSVIRMLRSELNYAEIAEGAPLSDEQALVILARELKKRKEAAAEFAAAGRNETADSLKQEQEIIKQYLPEPLTEEDVRQLVVQAVADTGAKTKGDFGKVMSRVMPLVKGRADGNLVSGLVRQLLDE